MNEPLSQRSCIPCRGGIPPLEQDRVEELITQIDGWRADGVHHIEKEFEFGNFAEALAFVNEVGAVAEEEDHHPDIWFTWGKCKIEIRTHKIDGLTESDFILAAKIDSLPPRLPV